MNPTTWIMIAIVIVMVIFIIITTITSKKANKKEKEKRKGEVREAIKKYMAEEQRQKNVRVEFERVYARQGAEYKYRDVFDVIVVLIEPKTNNKLEERAFEVEGISQKIDKKNYTTSWKVNKQLDLEETKRKIAIAEKEIKLTKEEKKALKAEEKLLAKKAKEKEKADLAKAKKEAKSAKKLTSIDPTIRVNEPKFVPSRKKEA